MYQDGCAETGVDESALAGRMESMTLDGTGENVEGLVPTGEFAGR